MRTRGEAGIYIAWINDIPVGVLIWESAGKTAGYVVLLVSYMPALCLRRLFAFYSNTQQRKDVWCNRLDTAQILLGQEAVD